MRMSWGWARSSETILPHQVCAPARHPRSHTSKTHTSWVAEGGAGRLAGRRRRGGCGSCGSRRSRTGQGARTRGGTRAQRRRLPLDLAALPLAALRTALAAVPGPSLLRGRGASVRRGLLRRRGRGHAVLCSGLDIGTPCVSSLGRPPRTPCHGFRGRFQSRLLRCTRLGAHRCGGLSGGDRGSGGLAVSQLELTLILEKVFLCEPLDLAGICWERGGMRRWVGPGRRLCGQCSNGGENMRSQR